MRATSLLLAKYADLQLRLPVGKFLRKEPAEWADVLSGDVVNLEKNRLEVWKWGTALHVGKTGAGPASSVTPFIRKAGSSS